MANLITLRKGKSMCRAGAGPYKEKQTARSEESCDQRPTSLRQTRRCVNGATWTTRSYHVIGFQKKIVNRSRDEAAKEQEWADLRIYRCKCKNSREGAFFRCIE